MNPQQLEQFLSFLQVLLTELHKLQLDKQASLARLDTGTLEQLSAKEGSLADKLTDLTERYHRFLAAMAAQGQPLSSLRELMASFPDADRGPLLDKLEQVRQLARTVKRDAAANWYATYRTHQHVQQMLEVIAQAGQPAGGLGVNSSTGSTTANGHGLCLDSKM